MRSRWQAMTELCRRQGGPIILLLVQGTRQAGQCKLAFCNPPCISPVLGPGTPAACCRRHGCTDETPAGLHPAHAALHAVPVPLLAPAAGPDHPASAAQMHRDGKGSLPVMVAVMMVVAMAVVEGSVTPSCDPPMAPPPKLPRSGHPHQTRRHAVCPSPPSGE